MQISKTKCRRLLRILELEAYRTVVNALRAQGKFTKYKYELLKNLAFILKISEERQRAEIRRAVNNDKLNTIAQCISDDQNTEKQWFLESHRSIPISTMIPEQTMFTALVDNMSSILTDKNKELPLFDEEGDALANDRKWSSHIEEISQFLEEFINNDPNCKEIVSCLEEIKYRNYNSLRCDDNKLSDILEMKMDKENLFLASPVYSSSEDNEPIIEAAKYVSPEITEREKRRRKRDETRFAGNAPSMDQNACNSNPCSIYNSPSMDQNACYSNPCAIYNAPSTDQQNACYSSNPCSLADECMKGNSITTPNLSPFEKNKDNYIFAEMKERLSGSLPPLETRAQDKIEIKLKRHKKQMLKRHKRQILRRNKKYNALALENSGELDHILAASKTELKKGGVVKISEDSDVSSDDDDGTSTISHISTDYERIVEFDDLDLEDCNSDHCSSSPSRSRVDFQRCCSDSSSSEKLKKGKKNGKDVQNDFMKIINRNVTEKSECTKSCTLKANAKETEKTTTTPDTTTTRRKKINNVQTIIGVKRRKRKRTVADNNISNEEDGNKLNKVLVICSDSSNSSSTTLKMNPKGTKGLNRRFSSINGKKCPNKKKKKEECNSDQRLNLHKITKTIACNGSSEIGTSISIGCSDSRSEKISSADNEVPLISSPPSFHNFSLIPNSRLRKRQLITNEPLAKRNKRQSKTTVYNESENNQMRIIAVDISEENVMDNNALSELLKQPGTDLSSENKENPDCNDREKELRELSKISIAHHNYTLPLLENDNVPTPVDESKSKVSNTTVVSKPNSDECNHRICSLDCSSSNKNHIDFLINNYEVCISNQREDSHVESLSTKDLSPTVLVDTFQDASEETYGTDYANFSHSVVDQFDLHEINEVTVVCDIHDLALTQNSYTALNEITEDKNNYH